MSTNGRMTHCDVFFLAGQKKATRGKAGLSAPVFDSAKGTSLLIVVDGRGALFFLFGLLMEEGAGMIAIALVHTRQSPALNNDLEDRRVAFEVAIDMAEPSVVGCSSSTLRAWPPPPARNFSRELYLPPQLSSNITTFSNRRIILIKHTFRNIELVARCLVGSFRGLGGLNFDCD